MKNLFQKTSISSVLDLAEITVSDLSSLQYFAEKNGEVSFYRFSDAKRYTISTFLKSFGLNPNDYDFTEFTLPKGTRQHANTPKSDVQGINVFKANQIANIVYRKENSKELLDYLFAKCAYAKTPEIKEKFNLFINGFQLVRQISSYRNASGNKVHGFSYEVGNKHCQATDELSKKLTFSKTNWTKTVYNNLFCHEFLKTDTKLVVCLEGENDTLAANFLFWACNLPFVGVTVGGVSSWTTAKEQLTHIREASPDALLVSLFDHDKAGIEAAQSLKNQSVKPIFWTNLLGNDIKNKFDFCDAMNTGSCVNVVRCLIDALQAPQNAQNNTANAPNAQNNTVNAPTTIHVPKYLSDKGSEILAFLRQNGRVSIQANTGVGKTHFVCNELKNNLHLFDCKHLVIVTPRKGLLFDYPTTCQKVWAKTTKDEIDKAIQDGKTIVCTVDSLIYLGEIIKDSCLVLDETQKYVSDTAFRNAHINILDVLPSAKKTVSITATPNHDVNKELGFNELIVKQLQRTKKYNVKFVQAKTQFEGIVKEIENTNGKVSVLLDNKATHKQIKEYFEKAGKKVLCIDKDNVYQCLKDTNFSEYDVYVGTNVIDSGVNFNFDIAKSVTVWGTSPTDCVQFTGRSRTVTSQLVSIVKVSETTETTEKHYTTFEREKKEALILCDRLNELAQKNKEWGIEKTDDEMLGYFLNSSKSNAYRCKKTGIWQIDTFGIANLCDVSPNTELGYFDALQAFDVAFASFEIVNNEITEQQSEALEEIKKEAKERRKEVKIKALDMCISNIDSAILLVNNEKTHECFEDKELLGEVKELVGKYNQVKQVFEVENANFLALSDTEFKFYYNTLVTQHAKKQTFGEMTEHNKERSKKLQKALNDAKITYRQFDFERLKGIVRTVYRDAKTVNDILSACFNVFDFDGKTPLDIIKNRDAKMPIGKVWNVDKINERFNTFSH